MEAATERTAFTGKEFRAALGSFATGVTVVTTLGEEHPYGMTANAFSSVSLDPPLVLLCVKAGTEAIEHIEANGVFAVNILAAEQEPVSRYFSSKDRPRGRDAFRDVPHRTVATGCPILKGTVGFLDCTLHTRHSVGDHEILIGEVVALESNAEAQPLLFHGGRYRLALPD